MFGVTGELAAIVVQHMQPAAAQTRPSCRLTHCMHCGRRFFDYCRLLQDDLMPRYGATEHWAKIEAHRLQPGAVAARLAARFPVDRFNAARGVLDPKNIMANDVVDTLFPRA